MYFWKKPKYYGNEDGLKTYKEQNIISPEFFKRGWLILELGLSRISSSGEVEIHTLQKLGLFLDISILTEFDYS